MRISIQKKYQFVHIYLIVSINSLGYQMAHTTTKENCVQPKRLEVIKSNASDYSPTNNNQRDSRNKSIEKYRALAQEAILKGDYVLAESHYQQVEHYLRLNNEDKKPTLD